MTLVTRILIISDLVNNEYHRVSARLTPVKVKRIVKQQLVWLAEDQFRACQSEFKFCNKNLFYILANSDHLVLFSRQLRLVA